MKLCLMARIWYVQLFFALKSSVIFFVLVYRSVAYVKKLVPLYSVLFEAVRQCITTPVQGTLVCLCLFVCVCVCHVHACIDLCNYYLQLDVVLSRYRVFIQRRTILSCLSKA